MDVVLELFDTFLFDYLYAVAVPVSQHAPLVSQLADGFNKTASALGNGYTYTPASQYLKLVPSKYAYLSSLPRDNMFRQCFSLFLITWYECLPLTLTRFLVFNLLTSILAQ